MTELLEFVVMLEFVESEGATPSGYEWSPHLSMVAASHTIPRAGDWLTLSVPVLLDLGESVSAKVERVEFKLRGRPIEPCPKVVVGAGDPGRAVRRALRLTSHKVDGWWTSGVFPEDRRVVPPDGV